MKTWLQFSIVSFLFFCLTPSVLFFIGNSFAGDPKDGDDFPEVAVIKVHQRPAGELLPQVQILLSASGRASVDSVTNTVIVSDNEGTIKKIRRLIRTLDSPTPQVTIILRYHQTKTNNRTLSTSGGISGPKRGLQSTNSTFHRKKNERITISSGSTGYLMIGQQIPFTTFWLDLCSRHGYRFSWLNEYTTVGIEFAVHPLVFENRVDLTLLPRLSFADGRTVQFTGAATRITIPPDTWVGLAAANSDINEVSAAILSANGQNNNRATVLEVMARIH